MMDRCLAFVLAGGGARGALQVGAMRALLEAGLKPDLLVGTSIGAVNATALALWGADLAGIEAVEQAWRDAADARLFDPRLARLIQRPPLNRFRRRASRKVTQFLVARGITPDLRFEQFTHPRLALVGADLYSGQTVVYGQDPRQSVLEGVLASIALPPLLGPIEQGDRCLVDGGLLSNLPIEPALSMGASEIVALDLHNPDTPKKAAHEVSELLMQVSFALHRRHADMETALAEARGVPVYCIDLTCPVATQTWDFSDYQLLIRTGYEIARANIPSLCSKAASRVSHQRISTDQLVASGPA